jgi:hypothetical protein
MVGVHRPKENLYISAALHPAYFLVDLNDSHPIRKRDCGAFGLNIFRADNSGGRQATRVQLTQ